MVTYPVLWKLNWLTVQNYNISFVSKQKQAKSKTVQANSFQLRLSHKQRYLIFKLDNQ